MHLRPYSDFCIVAPIRILQIFAAHPYPDFCIAAPYPDFTNFAPARVLYPGPANRYRIEITNPRNISGLPYVSPIGRPERGRTEQLGKESKCYLPLPRGLSNTTARRSAASDRPTPEQSAGSP